MRLTKQASGKIAIKMSRNEWESLGKKAGWLDKMKDKAKGLIDDFSNPQSGCPDCGGKLNSQNFGAYLIIECEACDYSKSIEQLNSLYDSHPSSNFGEW